MRHDVSQFKTNVQKITTKNKKNEKSNKRKITDIHKNK